MGGILYLGTNHGKLPKTLMAWSRKNQTVKLTASDLGFRWQQKCFIKTESYLRNQDIIRPAWKSVTITTKSDTRNQDIIRPTCLASSSVSSADWVSWEKFSTWKRPIRSTSTVAVRRLEMKIQGFWTLFFLTKLFSISHSETCVLRLVQTRRNLLQKRRAMSRYKLVAPLWKWTLNPANSFNCL